MPTLAVVKTTRFAVLTKVTKPITILYLVRNLDFVTQFFSFLWLQDLIVFLTCTSRLKKLQPTFIPTKRHLEQLVQFSLTKEITLSPSEVVQRLKCQNEINYGNMKKLSTFLRSIPAECDLKRKGVQVKSKSSRFRGHPHHSPTDHSWPKTSLILPSNRCSHSCANCGDCRRVVRWNCPACHCTSNECLQHCP